MRSRSTPARDDDATKPGLSRRGILVAGAWAVPLTVLATATPAAAASLPTPDYSGPAVASNTFSLYDEAIPGRGKVMTAVYYDRNAFPQGVNLPADPWYMAVNVPSSVTVGWRVVAIGPGSSPASQVVASGVSIAAPYGQSDQVTTEFSLPAGSYQFRFEYTSVTFAPNPVTQPNSSSAVFGNTSVNPLANQTFTIS